MIGRILLDNDYFCVTSGLLGGIKVALKSRNLTLEANKAERTKLLDVLDELKRRGYPVEPHSKEFENVLNTFSEAVWGKGDARWQAYFLVMTCEDIVIDAIGGTDRSGSVVLNEDYTSKDYSAAEIALSEWKDEATVMVEHIKTFVNEDGLVKFDDVEYLGYEIYVFLKWSEDYDDGYSVYDFKSDAKEMLKQVPINTTNNWSNKL